MGQLMIESKKEKYDMKRLTHRNRIQSNGGLLNIVLCFFVLFRFNSKMYSIIARMCMQGNLS